MVHKIKDAVSYIIKKLTSHTEENVDNKVLKLNRGNFPEHDTYMVTRTKKGLNISSIVPASICHMPNRFISGINAEFAEGQIWIEESVIPPVIPGPHIMKVIKTREEADTYVAASKAKLSERMAEIEKTLNVFIINKMNGGASFMFNGMKFWKRIFLKKNGCQTLEDRFKQRFKEVTTKEAAPELVKNHTKVSDYFGTSVYHESWMNNLFVVDLSWLKKSKSMDGCGIFFGNDKVLFHHDKGFDVKMKGILHVRGLSDKNTTENAGNTIKGTFQEVNYKQAKAYFRKPFRKLIVSAMEHGYVVMTNDTFKYSHPGRYHNVKIMWHNSSNQISFFQPVKITFSMDGMRRLFTHTNGLDNIIENNVKAFAHALSHTDNLIPYLLHNKDLFNDEDTPVREIVEALVQINNRRPFGLSRSDEYNVMKSLRNVIKGLIEVKVGTRNMDKWNLNEHNGIGMRAFAYGDTTLNNGEVSVPHFAGAIIHDKIEDMNMFNVELNRHPRLVTTTLPVKLIVRDDNIPKIGVAVEEDGGPTSDRQFIGADFDGDQLEIRIFPKSLFEYEDPRSIEKLPMPTGKSGKPLNIEKLMPKRNASNVKIPAHHNAHYELMAGEPIGAIHFFIENIGHWLNSMKMNKASILKVMNVMELGPLQDIIDAKKHNLDVAPHLIDIRRIQNMLKINAGQGYRIANAKIDFAKVEYQSKGSTEKKKLTLRQLPAYIKYIVSTTTISGTWPLHKKLFDSIMKYFPATVEGTTVDENAVPDARLDEIIDGLLCEYPDTLEDKMGFFDFGRLTNVILDKFWKRVMDKSGDPSRQEWIKRAIPIVWNMLIEKIETPEERAVAELMLLAYTYKTRAITTTGAAKHAWIFAKVSGVSFKKFHDLLFGEGDNPEDDVENILEGFFDFIDEDGEETEYDEALANEILG